MIEDPYCFSFLLSLFLDPFVIEMMMIQAAFITLKESLMRITTGTNCTNCHQRRRRYSTSTGAVQVAVAYLSTRSYQDGIVVDCFLGRSSFSKPCSTYYVNGSIKQYNSRISFKTNFYSLYHSKNHLNQIRHFAMSSEISPTVTETDKINVSLNYNKVKDNIEQICSTNNIQNVRLVAVSKTKPIQLLQAVYEKSDCKVFGENYVQELVEKVQQMPTDVQWHFIGTLQSNKCNTIINAMNGNINQLTIETISSIKLATKLNTAIDDCKINYDSTKPVQKLKVFVQVNTSGEDSKGGVDPGNDTIELCTYIIKNCSNLQLYGLMTIGAVNDTSCFTVLSECKINVQNEIKHQQQLLLLDDTNTNNNNNNNIEEIQLELSMGMSGDYEAAIVAGSTNVRVGSTIFGERDYTNKK